MRISDWSSDVCSSDLHLRHQIKELQRKLGVTTVMVTHDQEEALSMADRIVVMNHGVIEQIGTPTEIYRQPKSLFVADFIGETNQLHATLAASGRFTLGNASLAGTTDGLAPGQPIVVTIRPEDIIPHAPGTAAAVSGGSLVEVIIGEMEFLGSFWRSRLSGTALGDEQLVADFSINAVRDRTSTRLNSSHSCAARMPSSACKK